MDEETEILVTSWGLPNLVGHLRDNQIDIETLKLLKESDLEKLIQPIGQMVRFRSKWRTWLDNLELAPNLENNMNSSVELDEVDKFVSIIPPAAGFVVVDESSFENNTDCVITSADKTFTCSTPKTLNHDIPSKQLEICGLPENYVEELQLQLVSNQGDIACPAEHQQLHEKVQVLQEKNKFLTTSLDTALGRTVTLLERPQMAEAARDKMKVILSELNVKFNQTLQSVDSSLDDVQKTKLQHIGSMLDDLKGEHQKCEEEMRQFEEHLCVGSSEDSSQSPLASSPEEESACEQFILQQANLNKMIEELSKDLAWKEAVAAKLAESHSLEADIQPQSAESISELKAQINSLIHEKEQLEQQLKNRNSTVDHKLAEERRKRVKELEEKINNLNKKVMEQGRVIKMKEKNEEKINVLNKEIMSMKQTKVRLINQMKTEGEKYRAWRSTRDQEVCKLRQQNRQKETKFTKMETLYKNQQNVLKRKLEESSAVIKRLKETLALQKSVKEKKLVLNNAERVNQWVTQEFAGLMNTMEAEATLDNLIEDRTLLTKELSLLQDSLADPQLDNEERQKVESHIKRLNEDLELRSTQIVDLKQKLKSLDDYQDNKKNRWDNIHTMADAKMALKYVFNTATNYISEVFKDKKMKDNALQSLQDSYETLQSKLAEKERQLKEETSTLKKTESELNDKVYLLLRRLKHHENNYQHSASLMSETFPLKESTSRMNVEEMSMEDHKVFREQEDRIKELESELAKHQPKKPKKTSRSHTSDWNAVITPETRRKFFEEEDDEVENLDDSFNDPDWKKTPIYKSIARNKKVEGAVKRNIDGQTTCGCKGDCSTRVCSCRRVTQMCSGNCRCQEELCKNKETFELSTGDPNLTQVLSTSDPNVTHVLSTSNPNDDSGDDTMFKKPRLK